MAKKNLVMRQSYRAQDLAQEAAQVAKREAKAKRKAERRQHQVMADAPSAAASADPGVESMEIETMREFSKKKKFGKIGKKKEQKPLARGPVRTGPLARRALGQERKKGIGKVRKPSKIMKRLAKKQEKRHGMDF
jgi:hypothetical protein